MCIVDFKNKQNDQLRSSQYWPKSIIVIYNFDAAVIVGSTLQVKVQSTLRFIHN